MLKLNNFIISVVLFYLFVFITEIQCQLFEGQACVHQRSRSPGTCKLLDACQEAVQDFLEKDINPQLCSWKKNVQVICCRNTEPTKPLTSEVKIDTRNGISRGLCLYYASTVYSITNPIYNVPGSTPKNTSLCGVKYRPLIYGGTLAGGKEFPHMALIGYGEADSIDWSCGGSLITEEWVLTAAHCAYTAQGDAKFVRLGDLDYNDNNDDAQPQDFEVIQIEKHREHESKSHYNDIALLKLNKKAKITAYVRPACLWTKPEVQARNNKALVTGWGTKKFFGDKSSHLLQATLSLIPHSECNRTYPREKDKLEQGVVDEQQLCAGAAPNEPNKDTCQGDSGGPLQIFAEDVHCMYYIIGITSFGKPCGITRIPGVYTRVSRYIPWIENIVWKK